MAKIYNDKSGNWYGSNTYLTEKQQKFNAKSILNFFKNLSKYDWSNNSICAILGNMSFESTLNPLLDEVGGGSGYGLVQWTPKSKYIKLSKEIGMYKQYDTVYAQLSVIDYEVTKGLQWIKTSDYDISFKDFVTDTTHSVEWLTGAWLRNYERPLDQTQENINLRCNGDTSGHIGSLQWLESLDFDNSSSGSVDGFLNWCENIANDNKYLYKYGSAHGVSWDYTGIYFDCSSFVSFGLHNGGGYDLETKFSTETQKDELEKLGFTIIKFKNKSQLKRGDILLITGHTEVVYSVEDDKIKLIGAHNDNVPKDEQISIIDYYNDNWEYICRPNENDSVKPPYYKRNRMGMVFVYPRH